MNNIIKIELKDMEVGLISIVTSFGSKLLTSLSSFGGWIVGCGMALIAFLSPIKYLILFIFIITFVDLMLALWINRKNILSSKLRLSVFKIFFYIGTIALCFSMEALIGVALLYKIIFSLISLTELISICANALIIYPDIKVVGIFKKLLTGEIAKKLGIEVSEVDNLLSKKDKVEAKIEKGE